MISIQRPQNIITPTEIGDFLNIFQTTNDLVDDEVHGPGNYYEEITYEESEFETHVSPLVFSGTKSEG